MEGGEKRGEKKKNTYPIGGSRQKLVVSLTHSVSLETHCRLTSVLYTPYIRKIKRPCRGGGREAERTLNKKRSC